MKSMRKKSVEPSHDCIKAFGLIDRNPTIEVF